MDEKDKGRKRRRRKLSLPVKSGTKNKKIRRKFKKIEAD
jgi:hypothetical protein